MIKKSIIFFLFFSMPFMVGAEICSTADNEINIQASTPISQFDFGQDTETVTDKKTGLMWARCPWNYHWNSGSCDNDAFGKMTWTSALGKVNDNTVSETPYLGFSDWRLPNIKELASIVERKCASTTINRDVFSAAAPGSYWSNTHIDSNVRVINFESGQVADAGPDSALYLRLVRDCQSMISGVCQD